jgi:hypothetical protein
MTLRSRRGEAVILAVMGIMMVGGMLLGMFYGHSHRSAMHGGRNPASEVRSGEPPGGVHDAPEGHPGDEGEVVSARDRLQNTGVDKRDP